MRTRMLLCEDTRREARAALSCAFAEATRMPGNLLAFERLHALIAAARRIVTEVAKHPDPPVAPRASPQHPIEATVTGLLLGRRLFEDGDMLLQLGLGLFLQDVGKLALPPAVAHKPAPLA